MIASLDYQFRFDTKNMKAYLEISKVNKNLFYIPLLLGNGIVHSDFGIVQSEIIRSGFINSWSFIAFLIS